MHWEKSQQGLQHVPETEQLPVAAAKVVMSGCAGTPKMGCMPGLEPQSVLGNTWKKPTLCKLAAVADEGYGGAEDHFVACCWV